MRRTRFMRMAFPLVVLALSCQRNPTPIDQKIPKITLTVEEVAVTEAWLRLQVAEVPEGATFQLLRNDSTTRHGPLTTDDTLLYDDGLLPAHDYHYRAFLLKDEKRRATSGERTVTTMDTTSHDFQWEVIEIPSPYGSGWLRDVAIVNENNIYAVGEIYADSAQPWLPYNAVHWNGSEWELKRIYFPTICGQSSLTPYPAKAIFSFDDGRIWISSSGDKIAVLQDNNQISNFCLPSSVSMSINKIWGTSSNDVYVVGSNGLIAHYNGRSWQKLESPSVAGQGGTDLPIQDIWGAMNDKKGEYEILCVASDKYHNLGKKVLRIKEGNTFPIQDAGLSWSLSAIWFVPDRVYYICGDGVYPSTHLSKPWKRDNTFPFLYKHSIRGQAVNDVIVAGSFGLLSHFNGVNWKHYQGSQFPQAAYRSVAIKQNIVVAVGYLGRDGFIMIGRRG